MLANVETLKQLINILGPCGMEQLVRNFISKNIRKHVDEVYVDKFGNLVCHQKGKGDKIMLAAHMDEIGLMVKAIRLDGRMKIATIGTWEPASLLGQSVSLIDDNANLICDGVLTTEEIHEDFPIEKVPLIDDVYIDAGVDEQALIKKGVRVGTFAVPKHSAKFLGSESYISGKGIDNPL